MNYKKLFFSELIVLALSIISTFVFHMLYDWTGQNALISLFAPINESVWEHGKLIFFPFLIYSVIEYFFLKPKNTKNYFAIKFFASLIGVLAMTVMFYVYSGILGSNYLIMDVIIGLISVLITSFISYNYLKTNKQLKKPNLIILIGIILVLLFFIFTYFPPNLSWFISYA